MNKEYWLEWGKKAGVRAIKTVAQSMIASIGSTAAFSQVDWRIVLSTALLAGVVSILTSIAGLPEVKASKKGEQNNV